MVSDSKITFSVFAKPWHMPAAELGKFVSGLGFDAVELPVRVGYEVEPENVARKLPEVAKILGEHGVGIASIAGPSDEPTFAACAEGGVPIIRLMAGSGPEGYTATVDAERRLYESLIPLVERYGVKVGVQNHSGTYIPNAMCLRHLLEGFDPNHVAAIWDAAHNALSGEKPEQAIEIIWPHLCMVNLKNGFWRRTNGPEAAVAEWETYWTSGRYGLASWPRVVAELQKRDYSGVVCLTAEYTDQTSVDRLIAEDVAFAKSLFGVV